MMLTFLSILERDSALSYSVVVIFIILTGGLLIGAATKDRLGKQLAHTSLHAWFDVRRFHISTGRSRSLTELTFCMSLPLEANPAALDALSCDLKTLKYHRRARERLHYSSDVAIVYNYRPFSRIIHFQVPSSHSITGKEHHGSSSFLLDSLARNSLPYSMVQPDAR